MSIEWKTAVEDNAKQLRGVIDSDLLSSNGKERAPFAVIRPGGILQLLLYILYYLLYLYIIYIYIIISVVYY